MRLKIILKIRINGIIYVYSYNLYSILKYLTRLKNRLTRPILLIKKNSINIKIILLIFTYLKRCIYCFASRPQDPMARFCAECGKNLPPIPQLKIATPENGKVNYIFYLLYFLINIFNNISISRPL